MAPKKTKIKKAPTSQSDYSIPLPAEFEQLNQIEKLLLREDAGAKSRNKKCCRKDGLYYQILPSTEENSFDEDHPPDEPQKQPREEDDGYVAENETEQILFTATSNQNSGCFSGNSLTAMFLHSGSEEDTILRVHLEVKESFCSPEPPTRARIYSPVKQLIGYVKTHPPRFGQPGIPTYDICNVDQQTVFKAIPAETRAFTSIKYQFVNSNETTVGNFDQIGESRFTLEITSGAVDTLNRVRLLAFCLVQECINNWS